MIVTAKDIPGNNCIALIGDDQPCLAEELINHPEEPILLLAHPDRNHLAKAVEAVIETGDFHVSIAEIADDRYESAVSASEFP